MIGTREERQAALEALYPSWEPQTLFQLLEKKAEKLPQRPLLLTAGATFSYGQIWRGALQTAGALQALGIGPGSRVAVCLHNCPEYLLLTFALSCLGAVKIPINTELGPVERRCILEHVRPQLLLETDERGGIVCHGPALRRVLDWPGLLARSEGAPRPVPEMPGSPATSFTPPAPTAGPRGWC